MAMPVAERIVEHTILTIMRVISRPDVRGIETIPLRGPAILLTNHTSIFEGPVYRALLGRRSATALAKQELWNNRATRFLMQVWGIIPINREGSDRTAMNRALRALHRGAFLGIAGEGTRSPTGALLPGRPGAAMIALQAGVPIIPLVHWGMQQIPRNLKRLRRTAIHVRVGEPFRLNVPPGRRPPSKDLRAMTDEMMYQLAVLLPESLRGHYRDLAAMTTNYIQPVATRIIKQE